MVYDLLTELDKERIASYVNYNVYSNCAIEKLLSPWNNAKSGYLQKIFGDKLIITRPVEFKEGLDEIRERIEALVFQDERIKCFIEEIKEIYRKLCLNCNWDDPRIDHYETVCSLFHAWTLGRNKIDNSNFPYGTQNHFDIPINGKTLRIQIGMKPMRVISKIAKAYNIGMEPTVSLREGEKPISDFEYFRLKHSLALNQKLLKGDLCLSIHPLDYMTMSDNAEGWESCMSWFNDGEYKQGTVEMMNSPCVVVGYLSAGPEDLRWGAREEKDRWNSKKWRSLFIVDPDFIINVRSYPYDNDNLVKAAIGELCKLAKWEGAKIHSFDYINKGDEYRYKQKPCRIGGREVRIDFTTGAMYNDFGRDHYIALDPKDTEDLIERDYCYSGLSECMVCGSTNSCYIGVENGEGNLICGECEPHFWCEGCEDRVDGHEYGITADGFRLCEWCWDNHTYEDPLTGEIYYEDRVDLCLRHHNEKFRLCYITIYVNEDNVGGNRWNKYFKIDNYRTEHISEYGYLYYVNPEDCTEEGLELFDIYNEEDLKDYLGSNEPV